MRGDDDLAAIPGATAAHRAADRQRNSQLASRFGSPGNPSWAPGSPDGAQGRPLGADRTAHTPLG